MVIVHAAVRPMVISWPRAKPAPRLARGWVMTSLVTAAFFVDRLRGGGVTSATGAGVAAVRSSWLVGWLGVWCTGTVAARALPGRGPRTSLHTAHSTRAKNR